MKAVVIHRYGSPDVLTIEEVPRPSIKSDQLLVKVHAAAINPVDWRIRSGETKLLTGWRFPKFLGADIAGKVVEVGSRVTQFHIGDQIYGMLNALIGGGYAEYAAISTKVAAIKPKNVDYTQAAAIPIAGLTALQALRDLANIQPGQKVLVIGASGGVGTFALQIAKAFGAIVTGVCSGRNVELVKSIGADEVVDYTQSNFAKQVARYDVIFDTVHVSSLSHCKPVLTNEGVYITTEPRPMNFAAGLFSRLTAGPTAKVILARANSADLDVLREMVEVEQVRPVIDKIYPMHLAVLAHRYSETRRARGKLIFKFDL